jgi:hypothetical protein
VDYSLPFVHINNSGLKLPKLTKKAEVIRQQDKDFHNLAAAADYQESSPTVTCFPSQEQNTQKVMKIRVRVRMCCQTSAVPKPLSFTLKSNKKTTKNTLHTHTITKVSNLSYSDSNLVTCPILECSSRSIDGGFL